MSCGKPNWVLLTECAESLTRRGITSFTRRQLVACVQEKHPDRDRNSLSPMIQGMTINAPGGSPGGLGKKGFFRLSRGLYEIYDPKKHGDDSERPRPPMIRVDKRTSEVSDALVGSAVDHLSQRENAWPATSLSSRRPFLEDPGLYSWWADKPALNVFKEVLDVELPELIYAGQAGASKNVNRATLGSRIALHTHGTIGASTFRRTLGAILREPLKLTLNALELRYPSSERTLSEWIRSHLWVAVFPYSDRRSLATLEESVLKILDPPFNLWKMPRNELRDRLSAMRRHS